MSVTSFPRAEHIALLLAKIEERLRERRLPLEVANRGLNQMKCQYRFGFRQRLSSVHPPSSSAESETEPGNDWAELPIHFQIAQRLEEGQGDVEFDRILGNFLLRNFPEFPVAQDVG